MSFQAPITSNNTTSSQSTDSFGKLVPSITAVSDSFKELHLQFEQLREVNNTLVNFNESFSAFLFGMAANDITVSWDEAPSESSISKHKEYLQRINTLEATRPTSPPPPQPSQNANKSTRKKTVISQYQPGSMRKKQKTTHTTSQLPVSSRRFVNKIDIPRIIKGLPLKYQDRAPPNQHMINVLKILELYPSGLPVKALAAETKMPQYIVTDCINALEFRKEVVKIQEKGQYAKVLLDPRKYPSKDKS